MTNLAPCFYSFPQLLVVAVIYLVKIAGHKPSSIIKAFLCLFLVCGLCNSSCYKPCPISWHTSFTVPSTFAFTLETSSMS